MPDFPRSSTSPSHAQQSRAIPKPCVTRTQSVGSLSAQAVRLGGLASSSLWSFSASRCRGALRPGVAGTAIGNALTYAGCGELVVLGSPAVQLQAGSDSRPSSVL